MQCHQCQLVTVVCYMTYNHKMTVDQRSPTETRARINQNGRVVIPASFRKALGIRGGDELLLRMEDDEVRITTLRRRLERAQRRIREYVKPGTPLVDELIAERREAARRE